MRNKEALTLGQGNNGNKVEEENGNIWPVQKVGNDAQRDEDEKDVDLCCKEDQLEVAGDGGDLAANGLGLAVLVVEEGARLARQ